MRITIEDCIKELLINKEDDTYVLRNETINFAIETMRKYQIIVNDLKACEQDGMEFISVGFLKEIIDGNND